MHSNVAWRLSLTLECEDIKRTCGNASCGLDWGVETFAMLAFPDGTREPIGNPRLYQAEKSREIELERIRDRRRRGSHRRRKAAIRAARIKAKNQRRRHNFHHQVSAALINRFGLIATEKLQIANMTRSAKGTVDRPGKNVTQKAGLNREILDTAPARFLKYLSYKAAEAGAIYLEAPTKKLKPSQTCPACGTVRKKSLDERWHDCMTNLAMLRRLVPV
jgi:putative transposase